MMRGPNQRHGDAGEAMMRAIGICVVVLAMALGPMVRDSVAQTTSGSATTQQVTAMLRQFLQDAGTGNREGFDRFFADDVIYTRNTGVVSDKAAIMKGIGTIAPSAENTNSYSAEDITVHDFGDTAVLAFRLVARTEHKDGKVETANYRNTATFLRRRGRWQVVAWQATKIADASAAK
jgi:ketosteroid isomerase-like protein